MSAGAEQIVAAAKAFLSCASEFDASGTAPSECVVVTEVAPRVEGASGALRMLAGARAAAAGTHREAGLPDASAWLTRAMAGRPGAPPRPPWSSPSPWTRTHGRNKPSWRGAPRWRKPRRSRKLTPRYQEPKRSSSRSHDCARLGATGQEARGSPPSDDTGCCHDTRPAVARAQPQPDAESRCATSESRSVGCTTAIRTWPAPSPP